MPTNQEINEKIRILAKLIIARNPTPDQESALLKAVAKETKIPISRVRSVYNMAK